MDITLNEEQELIAATAGSFARSAGAEAKVRALEESETGFDPATWKEMAALGLAGAALPEAHGGSGLGLADLALIVEALGAQAVPSPLFSTVIEAGLLLAEAGSPEQRAAWLPAIAAGDALLTTAVFEPSGEVAPDTVRTTATFTNADILLSGTKLFVRDAGVAQAVICLARSGPEAGDLSLLLVPGDAPGLHRRRLPAAGGETLWELRLDDVRVSPDALVGARDGAWPHVARLLERGAAMKAAELVGIGQAALDLSVAYAKERVQFGRPIGSFQGVQHHCAEMYRDVEVCRLLAWQAAACLSAGGDAAREVAMAKAKASEAMPVATRMAHQIHGAIGYYRNYPLELFYHRAIAAQAAYGDAGHHRRTLARLLETDISRFIGEGYHDVPVHHF